MASGRVSIAWPFLRSGVRPAYPVLIIYLAFVQSPGKQRRINRLRRESGLPSGKTWETFERDRAPLTLRQQLDHLAQG